MRSRFGGLPAYILSSLLILPGVGGMIGRGDARRYVEASATQIMKEQEDAIGISHFGQPEITFELSEAYRYNPAFRLSVAGAYDRRNDTIFISLSSAETPGHPIRNRVKRILRFGSSEDVSGVLQHELGHFYADKLCESLGDCHSVQTAVNEGIAEYFSRFDGSRGNWEYDPYYDLVRPVIERHGRDGIEYLLRNPPAGSGAIAYQNEALRALAK
ncbi:MAG: hypothetical protein HYW25_03150 [Candidatus Aenigmarchaeota archaeon]|nr:hypothetical protein [Candidatus Aenigmarchaeota archaeon]